MNPFISEYRRKKGRIKKRLQEFKAKRSKEELFAELCFCLLTPQSKAILCDKAIRDLKESGLLFNGSERRIRFALKGLVRFHNKKASYIVGARKAFYLKKGFDIKRLLAHQDVLQIRHRLVRDIKGLGYKEASHFLRNIGFGRNMAILDVHILRNLKKLKIIDDIPGSLSEKNYLVIENKMRQFSEEIGIPLEDLDLLFWSQETGFLFK